MFCEARADLFVAQGLAALDLRQAFLDFAHEPIVVADQPLDCLTGQRLRVRSALVRNAREFGLHVSRQGHFHLASVPESRAESTRLRHFKAVNNS